MIRNPSNNISVLLLINSSPTRLMCRLISLGASVCWTIMAGPPPTIAARTGQTKVRNGKFLDILLSSPNLYVMTEKVGTWQGITALDWTG